MRALGQRALHNSRNVAAALSEVGRLFRSEKVRVRRRDHAKSAQKFHERIAKFPEFWRATRTEFIHLGQHALRKPYDVTEALGRVHGAFRSEKAGARRRDHANFVRKSRERIAKFPEFRRALRRKNCVYSASVRCVKSCNVAAALQSVGTLFRSEKVRVWRRAHAKFAQKFRERIAKFSEFRL